MIWFRFKINGSQQPDFGRNPNWVGWITVLFPLPKVKRAFLPHASTCLATQLVKHDIYLMFTTETPLSLPSSLAQIHKRTTSFKYWFTIIMFFIFNTFGRIRYFVYKTRLNKTVGVISFINIDLLHGSTASYTWTLQWKNFVHTKTIVKLQKEVFSFSKYVPSLLITGDPQKTALNDFNIYMYVCSRTSTKNSFATWTFKNFISAQ